MTYRRRWINAAIVASAAAVLIVAYSRACAEPVSFDEALDAYLTATTWATPVDGGIAINECADGQRALRAMKPEHAALAEPMIRRIPALTGPTQKLARAWLNTMPDADWSGETLTVSLHQWVKSHAQYFPSAFAAPLREAVLDAGMEPGHGLSVPGAPSTAGLPTGCTNLPCCGKNLPGCGGCWQTKCDCSACQGDQCICRRVDPDGVWLPCLPVPLQCSLIVFWKKPPKIEPQDTMQP